MRFLVLGGGCYGSFYARQLLAARDAGALPVEEIRVVDRNRDPPARNRVAADPVLRFATADWDDFLDGHLARLAADSEDRLVPSPFTPHLAARWLIRRLEEARPDLAWGIEPFRRLPGTPFAEQRARGPLLVSHADWICPVHCIEPATCPKTGGPRDWDLDRTARALVDSLAGAGQAVDRVHLFHCHHISHGVGGFRARELPEALKASRAVASPEPRLLVGTISHCHGALHLLRGRSGQDLATRRVNEGRATL